jgi:hypothetical protein
MSAGSRTPVCAISIIFFAINLDIIPVDKTNGAQCLLVGGRQAADLFRPIGTFCNKAIGSVPLIATHKACHRDREQAARRWRLFIVGE